jgi:hypothetical protein
MVTFWLLATQNTEGATRNAKPSVSVIRYNCQTTEDEDENEYDREY